MIVLVCLVMSSNKQELEDLLEVLEDLIPLDKHFGAILEEEQEQVKLVVQELLEDLKISLKNLNLSFQWEEINKPEDQQLLVKLKAKMFM